MMLRTVIPLIAGFALAATLTASAENLDLAELAQQVRNTEQAFAHSMAERDFDAFVSFLASETVFFSGETVLRGEKQVAEAWKPYFDTEEAPFSWEPTMVEVLDSGKLALSSGPVRNPGGQCIGTFTSIWRLETEGKWKIIFDKGSRDCVEQ